MAVIRRAANPTPSPMGVQVGDMGSLADSDFRDTNPPRKWQSISLLFGDTGCAKTSFAVYHMPSPVALINFDGRHMPAVERAREAGRRVLETHISLPASVLRTGEAETQRICGAAVGRARRNLEIAVRESQRGNIRSICLDTGTELAEILYLSVRGAKRDYGASDGFVNAEIRRCFDLAREGNAHFIMLTRSKSIWEGDEPTGRFTFRGPDPLAQGADWAAQIRWHGVRGKLSSTKQTAATRNKSRAFEIEITKSVIPSEAGEVYTESLWEDLGGPFSYINLLQYPGSSVEDWS